MAVDYSKLKVVELKAELKNLGLPTHGLKADLIARLEEASAATDAGPAADEEQGENGQGAYHQAATPDAAPDTDQPTSAPDVSHDAEPSEAAGPSQNGSAPDRQPDTSPQDASSPVEPPAPVEADNLPHPGSSLLDPEPQDTHQAAAPLDAQQDSQQKRKRSSPTPSPQPDDEETARKRMKQDDTEAAQGPTDAADVAIGSPIPPQEQPVDDEPPAEPDVDMTNGGPARPATQEGGGGRHHGAANNNGDDAAGVMTGFVKHQDASNRAASPLPSARDHMHVDAGAEVDEERHVEMSIHPATTALYVKNLMRPLRPQQLRDHLLDLATPAGAGPDDDGDGSGTTITDFYLDNIKTHAFVVFGAVSDASRVRSALHQRVWPDETNRKPLWVDFMPAERFADWVETEQASGGRGGRGSSSRFEVAYDQDDDGLVTARLEEVSAAPPPAAAGAAAADLSPPRERKPSIPTGPSNPGTGIESAPSGPRGGGRGPPAMDPSRGGGRLDNNRSSEEGAMTTRAYPPVSFKPVSEQLYDSRLDALSSAKARGFDRRSDSRDYKRYYFESGDYLVDRGPEIFLGIRPPHRERERQREMAGGGGPPGGGGGGAWRRGGRSGRPGGGGGGGSGGGGGGGMPRYHGVPKGGDRFRPSDSLGRDDRGSRY